MLRLRGPVHDVPRRLRVACSSLLFLTSCSPDAPSTLEPVSEAMQRVEGLWWLMFWISVAVVVFVSAALVLAAVRGRRPTGDEIDTSPVGWGNKFVVIAGLVVTGAILAATFVASLGVLDTLASPQDRGAPLEVEVVARNWWWEVRYPNGAVTANEIHIPTGEAVLVRLPSADVIHSFWVPRLQVKKDHLPGVENTLWLEADEPGVYRGQCAEFCGLQHAHMAFLVIAEPREQFDDWVQGEAEPAATPADADLVRGQEIFEASSCAGCHTIRGTTAEGDLGPDLTHLASRRTIGALLMPLTRENLVDFVTDPQDDKPGVTMPPTEIEGSQLVAVIDYLMSLE